LKKANVLSLALLLAFLIMIPMVAAPVKAEARSDLEITFYGSDTAAWTALVNGEIDFLQWALTEEQKEAAEADPNIQLARVDENGMFEFDINNNYTIKTYPGIRSITNELKVRQAIAYLVDKDAIIRDILHYYGVRIDQPIAAPQTEGWCNSSVIGPNYPYKYNPEMAAQLLREAGFTDEDGDGWVEYPPDWDGLAGLPAGQRGTDDYPLVLCVRSDHGHRLSAGYYILDQLETTLKATSLHAGIKTTGTQWFQPRSVLSPKVMGDRDYHIYTGGWSLGRYPTYLFSLFHSMFWYPYGSNYVTGMNKTNQPNYPDVDEAVAAIWYTASIEDAQVASQKFCYLHAKYCINIPLWSYSSYWAYRKTLVGVVNMNGYGIENAYTFLNAYRVDGGPIRMGTISGPSRLNILYSQWYFEYAFLDRVYTGAMSVQPYNLAIDQPWVVQDWETGTWVDADGTEKSKCTYYIRKDVGIVAPATGSKYTRNFNAEDFEFTVWYNYAFDDSWQWGSFMDIKYTEIKDVNGDNWPEFIVYFDDYSYWFYSAPTYPLLAPKEVLIQKLCGQTTEEWDQVGTTMHLLTNPVVQVVSCTLTNSTGTYPLKEGKDYIIVAGYDLSKHIGFQPLRDLTGHIVITYWYPDKPATGFYLAGLPWQETMYSLGTHYPVSMTTDPPGIGDIIALKKNPAFFLEVPPLGEVDWAWEWIGTTKPRSGQYAIRIYDVVKATAAYCTRGDGEYNPRWFPGADLDSSDLCHIGIYDVVLIVGKFGRTFGKPPT